MSAKKPGLKCSANERAVALRPSKHIRELLNFPVLLIRTSLQVAVQSNVNAKAKSSPQNVMFAMGRNDKPTNPHKFEASLGVQTNQVDFILSAF